MLATRGFAFAFLAIGLGACSPTFPPISDVGSDSAFKVMVATRFRPGTRAEILRRDLGAQGFAVTASEVPGFRFSAASAASNLPCFSYTRVDWNEDRRGRIALIQATRLPCR